MDGNKPEDNATLGANLATNVTNKSLANLDSSANTKLTGIESLADVTKTVSGPSEVTVRYLYDGTLATGEIPKLSSYKLVNSGGTTLTASWGVATISGSWSGTAPSISSSGVLTLNSGLASPEAVLNITATYGGTSYPPFAVKVKKETAAPPVSGGSGATFASDTSLGTFTSSFSAISDNLVVTTGASSTSVALTAANVVLYMDANYTNGTSYNCEFKWQRETSPGTWSDVAAAVNSSPDPMLNLVTDTEVIGEVTCNQSATGLSSSTEYTFRLVAKTTSAGSQTVTAYGTASAQG